MTETETSNPLPYLISALMLVYCFTICGFVYLPINYYLFIIWVLLLSTLCIFSSPYFFAAMSENK
jgi:hypothetical protein